MNPTQKLLAIARWRYPDIDWVSLPDGQIAANPFRGVEAKFDLDDRLTRQAVEIKLREAGWTIHERKRQGETVWEAVGGKGGTRESPSYLMLVYTLIPTEK